MSIPPVLAVPGGRAIGRLKRIGARGLLALLAAAVIMLVSVVGELLPDATVPLTWYVPVLDSAMLVTLAVVLFLSSSDVIIRRHGRLLPVAFVSVVLGMVWLQHMLTFPGVAPFTLPLVTNQTAPFLFQAGHIGTPALLAWILFHRTGPLARPRRSLFRTLAVALGVGIAAVAMTAGLALILPPLIINGRFTGLNTLLQAGPFLVLVFVAVLYRRARGPERRIETSVIAGLIFVSIETMVFMFMQARAPGWHRRSLHGRPPGCRGPAAGHGTAQGVTATASGHHRHFTKRRHQRGRDWIDHRLEPQGGGDLRLVAR